MDHLDSEDSATPNLKNEAQAIIDTVERLVEPMFGAVEDDQFVVIARDQRIESLKPIIDAFAKKPERRRGTVTLTTEDAFVSFVERFAGDNTIIFAKRDLKAPALTAVFDYHPATGKVEDAAFTQFRARYPFPLSKEWQRWLTQNDQAMEATAFAVFVEDNLLDVVAIGTAPEDEDLKTFAAAVGGRFASPSQLLDMSRSLQINVASSVKHAITLASGEISVAYNEQHQDGAGKPISVPNLFAIGIPIFEAGPRYRIPVRLRYRVNAGRITWSYSLVKPEASFDHAFTEAAERVANEEGTGLPLFYGEPEVTTA
jgi:uncharacterized protein YfdQ (DUF2303 family)